MSEPAPRICRFCLCRTTATQTKYGLRTECPKCLRYGWDGKTLAPSSTHGARIDAHKSFDRLWQQGVFSRKEAYRALAVYLGVEGKACHISLFDEEQCRKVILFANSLAFAEGVVGS